MSSPRSYLKLGLAVLFLILLILLSSLILPKKAPELKVPDLIKALNFSSTFEFVYRSEGLAKVVSDNLQGKEGEYAVYIEELPATTSATTGENEMEIYTLRSSDSFPAASLYKVFLMAVVLQEVDSQSVIASEAKQSSSELEPTKIASSKTPRNDENKLTLDSKLTISKQHLINVYGGVDFGYEDAPNQITYTIEDALTRVGRISDNFAAIMLMDKVGPEKVQAAADSVGATSTNIKSPISTSASDMGRFFKALYKGEVVNKKVSDEVIRFLSLNQLNNRIPAGVPEGVRVVHKTGELSGVRHDAGIVYLSDSTSEESKPTSEVSAHNTSEVKSANTSEVDQKAYIIVLMTQNLKYEDEGVETLAKISKDVYEYFKGKEED